MLLITKYDVYQCTLHCMQFSKRHAGWHRVTQDLELNLKFRNSFPYMRLCRIGHQLRCSLFRDIFGFTRPYNLIWFSEFVIVLTSTFGMEKMSKLGHFAYQKKTNKQTRRTRQPVHMRWVERFYSVSKRIENSVLSFCLCVCIRATVPSFSLFVHEYRQPSCNRSVLERREKLLVAVKYCMNAFYVSIY